MVRYYNKTFSISDEMLDRLREISLAEGLGLSEALRKCVEAYGPVQVEALENQIKLVQKEEQEALERAQAARNKAVKLAGMREKLMQTTLEKKDAKTELVVRELSFYKAYLSRTGRKPDLVDASDFLKTRKSTKTAVAKLGIDFNTFVFDVVQKAQEAST